MDETEYTEICDFLRGDELHKLWPDSVTSSKASKRNFRRKCASFELLNGTLHYRHKKYGAIRVIRQSEKDSILYACHKTPTAGHFGINKTDRTITERYYWPAHYKDVEEYIGKFQNPILENVNYDHNIALWQAFRVFYRYNIIP